VQKTVNKAPMLQLEKNLERYLSEVTGLKVTTDEISNSGLPHFFSRQYALYRLVIGATKFTAVFLQEEDEFKPVQFIKHMRQVPEIDVGELCVVSQFLPGYVRKRLIEQGTAFVIPGVQMYLPSLGMELRKRSQRKKARVVERFSPATQVVLINWLLGRIEAPTTALVLSKQLCYSAMTMSRALDELESSKIAQVERCGRERFVAFNDDRKAIWQESLPRLRNPVSQTVQVLEDELNRQDVLPAGVSALSYRSMLNEGNYPEYAISRDGWKTMKKKGGEQIPVEEPGTCLLQVWRYDPKILEVDGYVDPFSLYLSFQHGADERIEMALEEMIEQYL